MTSTAEKTRKITVRDTRFGWRVKHSHQGAPTPSGRLCLDELLAYRIGTSRAPLRLFFLEGPGGGAEYFRQHGFLRVVASSIVINLHRPATVAALIQQALDLGWTDAAPLIVSDGFAFVSAMPQQVRDRIAEPRQAPPE
jgi:hypothetical protein